MMLASASPRIITERLVLRLAERADIPLIVRYVTENRDFLAPWEPTRQASYYTSEFWTRTVVSYYEEWRQDRSLRLFLFEKEWPNRVVGIANINNIVRGPAQYATFGYGLAESAQGKGLMHEALAALIPYAFGEMKLHRLMANYLPRNERSGDLLRRLGFTVEGYARDYLQIAGKWEDHILTSLTQGIGPLTPLPPSPRVQGEGGV